MTFFSSKGGYYVYEATGGGGQDVYVQACAALDHSYVDPAAKSKPMSSCTDWPGTDKSFTTDSAGYVSWGSGFNMACEGQGQFSQQSIVPLSKLVACTPVHCCCHCPPPSI